MKFIGALMLAAGTTIGAGMLALPILTGLAGFIPTLWVYILSWIVMSYAGLLLLEVILWMPEEANLVSMAQSTLGTWARYFSLLVYLFLFYSVLVAYLAGSASVLVDILHSMGGWQITHFQGIVLGLCLLIPTVYLGTQTIAFANLALVVGICVSYFLLVYTGAPFVKGENLAHVEWKHCLVGVPVIITSFTFQNVIPSLVSYLKRNVFQLRWVVLLGGLIPLLLYIVWEWLVLGILPLMGPAGIQEALTLGEPATHALQNWMQNPRITLFSDGFSFCAIMTSFLGVVLGLFDFLADTTSIPKKGMGRLLLCVLIFTPPFFFAWVYPKAFFTALGYAGGIGCVLLFLVLPPMMVWNGRYRQHRVGPYRVAGGKPLLVLTALIGMGIFGLQVFS